MLLTLGLNALRICFDYQNLLTGFIPHLEIWFLYYSLKKTVLLTTLLKVGVRGKGFKHLVKSLLKYPQSELIRLIFSS